MDCELEEMVTCFSRHAMGGGAKGFSSESAGSKAVLPPGVDRKCRADEHPHLQVRASASERAPRGRPSPLCSSPQAAASDFSKSCCKLACALLLHLLLVGLGRADLYGLRVHGLVLINRLRHLSRLLSVERPQAVLHKVLQANLNSGSTSCMSSASKSRV